MPFKHSVLSSFLCLCFSAPASSKFNPKWQKYSPNLCIQGHFDLWRCSSNWLRQPIVSRFACCFVLFFVCLFVSTWRRIVSCSLIGSLIYRIFNLFLDRGNCLRIDGSERWANLIGDNRVNLLLIFICSFFDICVRVSFMNGFHEQSRKFAPAQWRYPPELRTNDTIESKRLRSASCTPHSNVIASSLTNYLRCLIKTTTKHKMKTTSFAMLLCTIKIRKK